jgi:hypothetical protein
VDGGEVSALAKEREVRRWQARKMTVGILAVIAGVLTVLIAYRTGEWEWLTISVVCFLAVRAQ